MNEAPEAWTATLDAARAGAISPAVALARLALTGTAPDPVLLARLAGEDDALRSVAELASGRAHRLAKLARLAADGLDPAGEDMNAATAALFDRLAAEEPEAAVAFYSLGDPVLLAQSTEELAGVVRTWARVTGRRVLDLGCGIGRLSFALAGEAASVLGLDVSSGMIGRARAAMDGLASVRFEVASGRDLAGVADGGVDLVVAADCFPYLVRAELLAPMMAEIARVLAPGGDLLVFNWSYRGDPARDAADARDLAAPNGFQVLRAGEHPFTMWDAGGFHLRRE